MAELKEGDRVRIVTRVPTDEDAKLNRYFGYFAGLTGSVLKAYDTVEATVDVEHESLPREIRKRHEDVRHQMKSKWLDGLSEEGRSKLTEREKDFFLRFVVLAQQTDLEKIGPKPAIAAPAARASIESAAPSDADDEDESGDAEAIEAAAASRSYCLSRSPAPSRKKPKPQVPGLTANAWCCIARSGSVSSFSLAKLK